MAFLSSQHIAPPQGGRLRAPRRLSRYLCTWLLLLLTISLARAEDVTREYELKAAFLYNFLLFVEWPQQSHPPTNAPLVIGVLGTDPFGNSLDEAMKGKTVSGHPIAIVRMKDARAWTNCHLLFVGQSERKNLPQILKTVAGQSVLTVGDQDRFSEQGGIINFFNEGPRIRFEINRAAAEDAGLKLDPKLLKLARIVNAPPPKR